MDRVAKTGQYTEEENEFCGKVVSCAGRPFVTMKGLEYSFEERGNELFFDRREKSITRAMVMCAYRRGMKLKATGVSVDGSKKLGIFGASYLLFNLT